MAPVAGLSEGAARTLRGVAAPEGEFFIDNLQVRIHFIIVMIRWTGLAPWEQLHHVLKFRESAFTAVERIWHTRQSRPDSGLAFLVKGFKPSKVVPSSLGSGTDRNQHGRRALPGWGVRCTWLPRS